VSFFSVPIEILYDFIHTHTHTHTRARARARLTSAYTRDKVRARNVWILFFTSKSDIPLD